MALVVQPLLDDTHKVLERVKEIVLLAKELEVRGRCTACEGRESDRVCLCVCLCVCVFKWVCFYVCECTCLCKVRQAEVCACVGPSACMQAYASLHCICISSCS